MSWDHPALDHLTSSCQASELETKHRAQLQRDSDLPATGTSEPCAAPQSLPGISSQCPTDPTCAEASGACKLCCRC